MNDKTKLTIAIIVIAIVIGAASYTHSVREDTRIAGLMFGNSILDIQKSLKASQDSLALHTRSYDSGVLDHNAILEYYEVHLDTMDATIARYDSLVTPPGFGAAVRLFQLSAESQKQSDSEFGLWIMNRDESNKLRSDELLQDAFEYESEGLAAFNAAKLGISS